MSISNTKELQLVEETFNNSNEFNIFFLINMVLEHHIYKELLYLPFQPNQIHYLFQILKNLIHFNFSNTDLVTQYLPFMAEVQGQYNFHVYI